MRAPNKVNDDINPFPIRDLLRFLVKVLRLVVHRVGCSVGQLQYKIYFILGRCGGRHCVATEEDQF